MFSKFFSKKSESDWRTVAIKYSYGYARKIDPATHHYHIILYQIDYKTGRRRIIADDTSEEGRNFALNENGYVAKSKTLWEQTGRIDTPSNPADITWVDPAYAPHGEFEDIITDVQRNDTLQEVLEDNPQIDAAWKQFITVVKMAKNTQ